MYIYINICIYTREYACLYKYVHIYKASYM